MLASALPANALCRIAVFCSEGRRAKPVRIAERPRTSSAFGVLPGLMVEGVARCLYLVRLLQCLAIIKADVRQLKVLLNVGPLVAVLCLLKASKGWSTALSS